MTQLDVYLLAHRAARDAWYARKEYLDAHPESELAKIAEQRAYARMNDIAMMITEYQLVNDD